jgi:TRAP-type mannitol/chloroaromatic compound transport system substrate-binding protein
MKTEYPNVQVKTFPKDVLVAMKKANQELLEEKAAADPLAKEIIESQAKYLKTTRVWTNISDRAYLDSVDSLGE